jgi:hypothetical protein
VPVNIDPDFDTLLGENAQGLRSGIRTSSSGRITPADAARVLGISDRTLRQWRDERRGPPAEYKRLWGSNWSYDLTALYQFLVESSM